MWVVNNQKENKMSVRATFSVQSITRTQGSVYRDGKSVLQEVQTIKLYAVSSGSDENKAFFASTPTGTIELGTVNIDVAKQFELNKEYYVDFTPASANAPERTNQKTPNPPCNHKWVTTTSRGDPQEPNERVIVCAECGAEKED